MLFFVELLIRLDDAGDELVADDVLAVELDDAQGATNELVPLHLDDVSQPAPRREELHHRADASRHDEGHDWLLDHVHDAELVSASHYVAVGLGADEPLPASKSDLSAEDNAAVSGASVTFGGISSALISGSDFVKGLGGAV